MITYTVNKNYATTVKLMSIQSQWLRGLQ